MNDCFTNPPTEKGSYNVSIRGVMSCAAIFWYFDGEKWDTSGWLSEPLAANVASWYEGTRRD